MDDYKISIKRLRRVSELEIQGDELSFRCLISNAYSTRNRRQFLLTIYNAVMPHLEFVKRSTIHHDHHMPPLIYSHDEFSKLSTRQGINIEDGKGELGYFIRGIRTKLGESETQFKNSQKN